MQIVACAYYYSPESLIKKLDKLCLRHGFIGSGVIVDNNHRAQLINFKNSRWVVIKGTNHDLDFSAYSAGAKYLSDINHLNQEPIIFINDSLFFKHNASINFSSLVKVLPLLYKVEVPAIAGYQGKYIALCDRNPWGGGPGFIATYLFGLNNLGMHYLLGLYKLAEEDGLNIIDIGSKEWGKNLPPSFREYLLACVYYKRSPMYWNVGFISHKQTKNLAQKKARCIYYEHRLTGEISKCGCIIPFNLGIKSRLCILFLDAINLFIHRLTNAKFY